MLHLLLRSESLGHLKEKEALKQDGRSGIIVSSNQWYSEIPFGEIRKAVSVFENMTRRFLGAVMIFGLVISAGVSSGQEATPSTAGTQSTPTPLKPSGVRAIPDIDQRLASVDSRLKGQNTEVLKNETNSILVERRDALLQIRDLQRKLSDLKPEENTLEPGNEAARNLKTLEAVNARLDDLSSSLAALQEVLPAQKSALDMTSREKKKAASAGDSGDTFSLAEEREYLAASRLELTRRRIEATRRSFEKLRELRNKIEREFKGSPQEFDLLMQELAKKEAKWRRRAESVRVHVDAARSILEKDTPLLGESPGSREAERSAARELEAQAFLAEQEVSVGEIKRISRLMEIWQRRWKILTGDVTREEEKNWISELDPKISERENEVRLAEALKAQLDRERTILERRSVEASATGFLRKEIAFQQEIIEIRKAQLEGARTELRLLRRLKGELERALGYLSFRERMMLAFKALKSWWNFPLGQVQGRSITLGSIVLAILCLLLGIWLAGRLTRLASARLLPRMGLAEGSAEALATLLRYLLIVLVTLFALWFAGIPLTVFTLLGGALAIGVGLGSQNLVNNFISGLVLLVELPIKVGDLVEIDGTAGKVEAIGVRATRIRTFDNTHIVVPNSQLLEKNLMNWTLSDHHVRVHLRVGVAYGSPVRRVEEILNQILVDHPKVLKNPEPAVFFEDFADSALVFEALFRITMRSILDRKRVLSDIRFKIDELFRKEGIVIAFPQQDVHLDVPGPIELKWTPGGKNRDGQDR